MAPFAPTLRARLTLWYCAILAMPLIGFSVAADATLHRVLLSRTDHFIADGIAAFSTGLASEMREHYQAVNATAIAIAEGFYEVDFPELRVVLLDSSFAVVGASPRATARGQRIEQDIASGDSSKRNRRKASQVFNVMSAVASVRDQRRRQQQTTSFTDAIGNFRVNTRDVRLGNATFVLVGAYPLDELRAVESLVRKVYVVAIPILLLSAALGGYVMAKRGLLPLTAMASRAGEIGETNLHERLPVKNPRDELGTLALVVNRLLGRLESAFGTQRRFMADASHELRTPISILQSEVDVTLARQQRTNDEYRASALVMRDATRRLNRIVEELFLVSRADAGHLVPRQDNLDLEAVVDDSVRAIRQVAAQRDVRIELRPLVAAPFVGDADLLGRLLHNLLDNAIKHSPKGGTVTIELARRSAMYEIRVTDNGSGIPVEAQRHVFERFYRVDPARSRDEASITSGAGLGLAIGRWIAESHKGTLDLVHSEPGRTEFRVELPAA